MKYLTFKEYQNWPLTKLVKHPDFSPHAFRVVEAITKMKTKQIENIDVKGVK